jgi:hypothetical protein
VIESTQPTQSAPATPENAAPISFPCLAIEGMATADGRYIEPGALTHRAVPLTLYAQTRTPDGGQGHDNADVVGALTELTRTPGPDVVSKSTGQPFPDGTFVWSGKGWMYNDVPAFRMVKDGALSGNSVDLSAVVADVSMADDGNEQLNMVEGVIGATTLVGLPAFPDAYVVLDGQTIEPNAQALAASATPMWRSADLGDACSPCLAGQLVAAVNSAGFASLPFASDSTAWDAGAATKRIEAWAGNDTGKLSTAFLYRDDAADAKTIGAWGFPLVDIIDGKPKIVPAAVSAAAGRLDGSNMPTADKERAKTVLALTYRRMGKTAPWEQDLRAAGDQYPTSGMVALMPDNPEAFTVPGGDPADEMHCTMLYLGDDLPEWSPQDIADVHSGVNQAIAHHNSSAMDPDGDGDDDTTPEGDTDHDVFPAAAGEQPGDFADASGPGVEGDAGDKTTTPQIPQPRPKPPQKRGGPIKAHVLGPSLFNPNGGKTGKQTPAAVHLLGDSADVGDFRDKVHQHVTAMLGGRRKLPEQHTPFVPHVTAKQSPDAAKVLPKLNHPGPVKFSKVRVATPQHTVDYPLNGGKPSMVASSARVLPASHFEDPKLAGPTPLTFAEDGRVFGHIATWGTCHIGFGGQCVTPPKSATKYAYFHTGEVLTDAGPVAVGHLTFGTGHAGGKLSAASTVRHYDDTGTVGADVVCGEDAHGIWVSGAVRDGLSAKDWRAFRAAPPSGDWRNIGGTLELVAVLGVNTPGFPVPRARVASGVQLALVAAGRLEQVPVMQPVTVDMEALAEAVVRRMDARDALRAQGVAALSQLAELSGHSVELEEDPLMQLAVEIELLAEGDGQFNWVEDAGGLPLPVKKIEKHLEAKGMDKSRAIATAVNVVKKGCATGDLNWPGQQEVNAGTRAEWCAAAADWEAKKAKSHAD